MNKGGKNVVLKRHSRENKRLSKRYGKCTNREEVGMTLPLSSGWLVERFGSIFKSRVLSVLLHAHENPACLIPIMSISVNGGMKRLLQHNSFSKNYRKKDIKEGSLSSRMW
jgi:hypothetical protein